MLAVMLGIIALPFILLHNNHLRKKRKFMDELLSLSEGSHPILSDHDFWRNRYAIGLDSENKKLFYINKLKETSFVLDLKEFVSCRIISSTRGISGSNSTGSVIEKLDLALSPVSGTGSETILEFFDHDVYMTPDGEIPLIEKWNSIIGSSIKRKNRNL